MRKIYIVCMVIFCCFVSLSVAQQEKRTASKVIYQLHFINENDGCKVLSTRGHYDGIGSRTRKYGTILPNHRNDNTYVNNEVVQFNRNVTRLGAVTEDNQNGIFNRTPVGGYYYVYRISYDYVDEYDWYSGINETVPLYHYIIWEVSVY